MGKESFGLMMPDPLRERLAYMCIGKPVYIHALACQHFHGDTGTG